jgi:phosphatidylglycerol lysyltransferase
VIAAGADDRPIGRSATSGLVFALPALLLGAAALLALMHTTVRQIAQLRLLPLIVPIGSGESQPWVGLASAGALGLLAIGVARRKRTAWWLATAVLAAALIAQVALHHPVAGMLAALAFGILMVDRSRYSVRTGRVWQRGAVVLIAFGAFLAIAGLALAIGTGIGLVSIGTDAADFGAALASWLAFGDPRPWVGASSGAAFLATVTVVARLALVAGLVMTLRPGDGTATSEALQRHARSVGHRFGRGALLPFQLQSSIGHFSAPGHDGMVAFGRDGRVAVILGDPIGTDPDAWDVLRGFLGECVLQDWIPAVYQASGSSAPHLHEAGFRLYRIGLEALVDLPSFDLAGSRRANLRHTVTRARRTGVTAKWYPYGLGTALDRYADSFIEIDAGWLRGRPPMRFTISHFSLTEMATSPIALAVDDSDRPLAFATFLPTGNDGGWVVDLMRRRPDATPGSMELCIVQAAAGLREAGAAQLSLGLAPLAGLSPHHGSPVERMLAAGARLAGSAYDVRGLAFFKAKFDPHWEPHFLAVRRRRHLPSVLLALLRLHVGGTLGLLRSAEAELPGRRRGRAA